MMYGHKKKKIFSNLTPENQGYGFIKEAKANNINESIRRLEKLRLKPRKARY